MTPTATLTSPQRISLAAAIICTSAVGMTMGLLWPLLSLILDHQGVDGRLIGLSSASQSLALLAVSPFASRFIARLGMVRSAGTCILAILAMLALLRVFPDVRAWFAIRFVLGAGTAALFICTQTWVNQLAPERARGRIIGIFGFLWSAGFGAGPLVIRITGIEGWPPFIAAIGIVALAGLPLLFAADSAAPLARAPLGRRVLPMLQLGGAAMAASLIQGLLDTVVDSFLPLYGLRNGLDQGSAVTMLIVCQGGVLAVQLPIGWAADRMDRGRLLIAMTALALLASVLLPMAVGHALALWPTLFLLGIAGGGIWNVSLVLVGQLFQGAELPPALALRSILYGLGSVVGPPFAGLGFEIWGQIALPVVLALACGALLLMQAGSLRRLRGVRR